MLDASASSPENQKPAQLAPSPEAALPDHVNDMLKRLRRIGWVLCGDDALADQLLLPTLQSFTDANPDEKSLGTLIALSLTTYRAAHDATPFPRPESKWQAQAGALGDLSKLQHAHREIIALALVEELPPKLIDELLACPRKQWEAELEDAMSQLELGE